MAEPQSMRSETTNHPHRDENEASVTTTKSSTESSDSENKSVDWVPPVDLSALKLSHTSIRQRSMPRRQSKAATPEGAPLMNTENKGGKSSILKLPLPPDNTPLRRMSLGSNSGATSQPTPTSKPSPLTRKAQRYSSLKKKKNNPSPSKLLNRLFCNNPMSSSADDDEIEGRDSLEENRSPHAKTTQQEDASCIKLGKQVLEEASESLTLRDEAKVRETVQSNLADSFLNTCGAPNVSPPSVKKESTDDDSTVATKEVKLVGHAAVGSFGTSQRKTFKKTVSILDEDEEDDDDIEEPNTKISMSHDDDIAETASQPAPETKKTETNIVKSKSNEEAKTPSPLPKKAMKTPGGLVIPTPFLNNGKGLFPSTIEHYYSKPSVHKSPPRSNRRKSPRSGSRSPRKKTKSKLQNSPPVLSMTASTSSSMTATTGTDTASVEGPNVSPPPMVRITSSLEDLSTVHEASTSKETKSKEESDSDPMAKIAMSDNSKNVLVQSSNSDSSNSKRDPLAAAQKLLRDELLEQQLCLSKSGSSSSDATDKNSKFKTTYDKNEKKMNELKDQAAIASRLARMRLHEIERLEKVMDEMKESQVDESEIARLRDRLEQMQASKKKEVDRVKREMEAAMNEKIQNLLSDMGRGDGSATKDSYVEKLEKELAQVKAQLLVVKACETDDDLDIMQVASGDPETEVIRLKQELADVTEKLAMSSFSANGNVMPSDYKRLENELAITKASLAAKKDEIRKLKSRKPPRSSPSPNRSRAMSPGRKDLLEKVDTLEIQLESERKSILQVDAKLASTKKAMEDLKSKHAEELHTVKTKTEKEIQRLNGELEDRLALEEAMQIATNEKDAASEEISKLQSQLSGIEQVHKDAVEHLRKQHQDDFALVREHHTAELEKFEQERMSLKEDSEKAIQETRQKIQVEMEEKLQAAGAAHKSCTAELEKLLVESQTTHEATLVELRSKHETEIKSYEDQATMGEKKLREEYNALKDELAHRERMLNEANENHNKQFEELLAQLDLVEAEHKESMAQKDKSLSEKQAIVDALGSQLSDAKNRVTDVEKLLANETDRTRDAQRICEDLGKRISAHEKEIETLKSAHQKFVKEAAATQRKACDEAREEMIQKAEIQFQQANEHYVKLRKQYDETLARSKKLETDVRTLKRKYDKAQKDKESSEVDLKAELAEANSKIAKAEADFAKKAKDYRKEMEKTLQTAKEFEAKADKAEKTSTNVQTTLATVVAEKAQLQKEYDEMKSVSEELMAIVEGNEAKHEC